MAQSTKDHKQQIIVQLKLMYSNKLFTEDEIKSIINKRRELENKLKRDEKCTMDHANLIKFESGLYQEIKRRRELTSNTNDVDKIDLPLAQYIDTLYKNTLHSYPSNIGIWTAFIKFSTRMGFIDSISETFAKILETYTGKPQLWLKAANWEKEENKSLEIALGYLLRGLKQHHKHVSLLTEAFHYTLLNAQDKDKDLSEAEAMYRSALEKVQDVEFALNLLKVTELYEFAESLQQKIIHDVKLLFPKEEKVFHAIAQNSLQSKANSKKSSNERHQSCIGIYKQAIKDLPTNKMWAFYIDHLLELNKDKDVYLIDEREALLVAVEEAHGVDMLNADQYLQWLLILDSDVGHGEEMSKIVEEIASKKIHSVELWRSLIFYYIIDKKSEMIKQTFDQAVQILGEDSFPIWNLMIIYNLSQPNNPEHCIRNVFLEAMKQPEKVSQRIKPKYLEYLVITKNITFARNAYRALATCKPYCLKLHQTMALLEKLQIEPDIVNWRKSYENATNLFGQNNKDVWIDHIKFENIHGDPLQVPIIYAKAKETLDAALINTFESDYNEALKAVNED